MRNLIKKILIETIEDNNEEVDDNKEFTDELLDRVISFLKRMKISDNVCSILLIPYYSNSEVSFWVILKDEWLGRDEKKLIEKKVKAVFSNYNVQPLEWTGGNTQDCNSFLEGFKMVFQNNPDYPGKVFVPDQKDTLYESEEDKDLILNRAIKKAIDLELKYPHYNKDKTKILILNKNKKCLVQYDIKNKKLWYDNSFLDKIMTMIVTRGYLGDQFKDALREWFNYEFEKHGYHVDQNKKVEGANIYLY